MRYKKAIQDELRRLRGEWILRDAEQKIEYQRKLDRNRKPVPVGPPPGKSTLRIRLDRIVREMKIDDAWRQVAKLNGSWGEADILDDPEGSDTSKPNEDLDWDW